MKKLSKLVLITLVASFLILQSGIVFGQAGKGQLYYNGNVIRTVVPNGKPLTKPGTDPLYVFPNGEQYSITKFAPGDKEYRGGHWAVYTVTWNVDPYLLTSFEQLDAAETAGNVTITRDPSLDVLCPVLPGMKTTWP